MQVGLYLSPRGNYDTHKLEFLALNWSIMERFHEYLYGGHFEVYTDNNPLTYILTTAKLDATGQRLVANLANYNFKIFYRSGKLNVEADALVTYSMREYTSRTYGAFDCKDNVAIKIRV